MKYCVILVLAVILASCGLSKPEFTPVNRVVIQFRDQSVQEYYLLSVRDQSLVVSKANPCGHRLDSIIDAVKVVGFDDIEKVYRESERSLTGTFIPTLVDCFQGPSAFRVKVYGYSLIPFFNALQYTIGYLTSDKYDQFTLSSERDVHNLRTYIASFPEKEPEVLKFAKSNR